MKQRSGDAAASACQTIFIRAQVASQDKLFGLLNQPDEIAISYPSRFVNAFPTNPGSSVRSFSIFFVNCVVQTGA